MFFLYVELKVYGSWLGGGDAKLLLIRYFVFKKNPCIR